MDYKKIKTNSYDLSLIKTDKFKTIFFKIVFWEPIKKEDITIRNLLVDNLTFSTKTHPTKKEMSIYKQDLYGTDLVGYNKRIGNYIYTEIYMSLLNPKYTEEEMLEKSIDFLCDAIYNPNVKDEAFDEEIFELIKNNTKDEIIRHQENPEILTFVNLKNAVDDSKAFAFKLEGYIEDLEKINSKDLYKYYKEFLKNNYIDIFVVGNFNEEKIKTIIEKKFHFKRTKEITKPISISYQNQKRTINEKIDNSSFNQSKLAIACNLNNLTTYEKKYPLALYNIILGNSPESKFFQNIREKKSYAYYINSSFRRYDDLLYITAGISYKNYELVKSTISEEMQEISLGNFTNDELENAKQLYISALKDTEEYPSALADYVYSLEHLEADDVELQIETIKNLTKEEVVNVSKKITIDTIYLLKEKENEKD